LELTDVLASIPSSAWSLPSSFAATGVHHGYRRLDLPGEGWFDYVLEQFQPIRTVWGSWIDPGGFIIPHRDAGPYYERWQIPIITSGQFEDYDQEPGHAFKVEHWLPHSVWNTGEGPRVHLVLDRELIANPVRLPFETYPVPDNRKEFVNG
jgi:hypothetical protein